MSRRTLSSACAGAALLALTASSASAQAVRPRTAPSPRIQLSVGGAFGTTARDFDQGITFREYEENGRIDTEYRVRTGPVLNASAGARLWRHVGVGVGVTRFTRRTPTTITASVPHPFFFDRPRTVSGEVPGLRREELAVHAQVRGIYPVSPRLEVTVFGGPSFFSVRQGLVDDIEYRESYPYDEATFTTAVVDRADASRFGFNVGGDVGYFFSRHVGVGVGAQYAAVALDLRSSGGNTVRVDAGGLHTGVGVRLRF